LSSAEATSRCGTPLMADRLAAYPKRASIQDTVQIPLDSGVFPSVHEFSVPLWKTGSNVVFHDGAVLTDKGWNTPDGFPLLFDDATGDFDDAPGDFDDGGPGTTYSNSLAVPINGLLQQRLSTGGLAVYIGTATSLQRTTGGAVASLGGLYQGFTDQLETTPATLWSMESWGDWTFAANGIDAVQVYKEDETTAFAALAGVLVDTAEIVLRLGQFLLLFNTSDSDRGYSWCAAGQPENWDPVQYPTAGQAIVRELPGAMVAAVMLGDAIMMYGANASFRLSFVQAPFMFGHKRAATGIGALSKHSVVEANGRHYGWGPLGIWASDGSEAFDYISDPALRSYITDNLNTAQQTKIWGWHDEAQSRIVWYYPKGSDTDNSESLAYGYLNNSWTIGDYGRSAATERSVLDYPTGGTATGGLFAQGRTDNAAGSALAKSVQTKPLDLGDPDVHKFVDVVRTRIRDLAGAGCNITLGYQEDIDDSIDWDTAAALADGFEFTNSQRETAFLTVKLTCTATDDAFRLGGFEVLGVAGGDDF